MDRNLVALKPALVWKHFAEIVRIPRPSSHEEKIRRYILDFARAQGLESKEDAAHNVYVRKPASKGMEDRKGVILQAHLDMVPQKNNDKEFDFTKDPIDAYIDGGWVTADGTTLGADNGIGVAAILAVLEDRTLKHGPLEALFTATEETGMDGANGLEKGLLHGDILLNLDSEEEGELYVGCAGGLDASMTFSYEEESVPASSTAFLVEVKGLKGGHSGIEIVLERGNANLVLFRLLKMAEKAFGLRLSSVDGGGLRNAIPREAYAIFGVPTRFKSEFVKRYDLFAADLKAEFRFREPNFKITLNEMPEVDQVLDARTQFGLVYSLVGVPNGVIAMSFAMPGLVETSTNLASVKFEGDNRIVVTSSQRSSVESAKTYVMQMVESVFALAGADVAHSDGYPGWAPNPQSVLLEKTVGAYERLFGAEPKVRAIHAGLECGLFLEKYPELEMVSFGPTLRGVHSPDERLEIATVQKFWDLLCAVVGSL